MNSTLLKEDLQRVLFWLRVDELCVFFDASQTSGRRSVKRNKVVGGSPVSRHLEGLAVDVVCDMTHNNPLLAKKARTMGLYVHVEEDHVHLQAVAPRS